MSEPAAFDAAWPDPMCDVRGPRVAAAPVVGHIPHSSTLIPRDVRAEILVDDEDLRMELIRLTDWYTEGLFAWLRNHGATILVNRLSRFVFDPERFLGDVAEPAEAIGQGVVYTHGTRGQKLREADPELRSRRIETLYRPYHATLDAIVGRLVRRFGVCTLIDGHSFSSEPLPSELDQSPHRPDICIGTDATHTPPELADAMLQAFADQGFRVRRDSPFSGSFVPSASYGHDRRVRSVMIEVRRGLYMDEASARRRADFEAVRSAIERAVSATGIFG